MRSQQNDEAFIVPDEQYVQAKLIALGSTAGPAWLISKAHGTGVTAGPASAVLLWIVERQTVVLESFARQAEANRKQAAAFRADVRAAMTASLDPKPDAPQIQKQMNLPDSKLRAVQKAMQMIRAESSVLRVGSSDTPGKDECRSSERESLSRPDDPGG